MAKKNSDPSKNDAGALTHNPFAGLARRSAVDSTLASGIPSPIVRAPPFKPSAAAKPPRPCRLSLRLETAGRSGKVVTRIKGLPVDNLETIAIKLRKALGCGATVEGDDLLLLGSLAERAEQWLERAGDLHAIEAAQPASESATSSTPIVGETLPYKASSVGTAAPASGTKRCDIRRGQRVAIVMKADQATGTLTEGTVRDLLTNSTEHHRGIKVRLESGEIGRVKVIFG
jgi:uncharacterized repeat protein (TIGR03833 family)